MPRGYWSAILAVVGLATLSLSAIGWIALEGRNQYNEPAQTNQSTATQNQKYIEQGPPRNRAGLPEFAHGVTDNPKPENDTERNNRDLAAQESMAAWAFWLLLFTGVGLFVTSVGTGFLLWQIMLTREAVKDTGDATKAMNEANEIARMFGKSQNEVILSLKMLSVEIRKDGLHQIGATMYRIRDAFGSHISCSAKLLVYFGEDEYFSADGVDGTNIPTETGPAVPDTGIRFSVEMDDLTFDEIIKREIDGHPLRVSLQFELTYCTGFGDRIVKYYSTNPGLNARPFTPDGNAIYLQDPMGFFINETRDENYLQKQKDKQ